MPRSSNRRREILQSLAAELEKQPGARITTAALARSAGVSEAALYRHFASKAKMFEALIEFAEESVFVRINQILTEEPGTRERCARMLHLLLAFSARNPGITRVLMGDALVGETGRLLLRVEQFFARIETQLKQILRESRLRQDLDSRLPAEEAAMMLAWVEGRMHQFLRSRFALSPLRRWEEHWQVLELGLFAGVGPDEPSG